MPGTENSSSSPPAEEQLVTVATEQVHPHPANANLMSEERLQKLARNIEREGRYPPLVARPHPEHTDAWELLDGHQRLEVLRRLGHREVLVYPWPCDDETALLLLATLNRLEGEDLPGRRAELLAGLTELMSAEELALLLPEDAHEIEQTLQLIDLDVDALLAELTERAEREAASGPRLVSFAVQRGDEPLIERAVARAMEDMTGKNRRGRALALICASYLEDDDA